MKKIKVISSLAMLLVISFSMVTGAAAFDPYQQAEAGIIASYNTQFEREDVSVSTAASDTGLSEEKILDYVNENNEEALTRSVAWYCEGWYEDYSYNSMGYSIQRPCGCTEHRNGTTVLSTYHYTRTYLNDSKKYGDSGRIWGNGSVVAKGTLVDSEICALNVHYVKYGTTSS